jgi:thymidine kinase
MWGFFTLFVTYFVHNVSATVSYGKKELLDIRTEITHLVLDKYFFFNKQEAQDILQTPDSANIPVICNRRRRRYRGH